ncbi:unnamed protein product [Phytophthora fragariaefolia]|uniref:Unnamed protein product n=1 Tax=Phytophthora fragariaefolia TaxID=1490495 RepID=A0A9W6XX15_9STRA|nr:unnamed protein product [Phytophthora fragariaefolia]
MATLSLSELKDALTSLGVSTATGNLRGEARRDELARRLHHTQVVNEGVGMKEVGSEKEVRGLQKLSLAELRSALELRQISTQTPGLKGDARRHALIQRLINACSNKLLDVCDVNSSRVGSSDDEEEDTKSEASSSVYSMATEFIFYDAKENPRAQPEQLQATSLKSRLPLTGLKKAQNELDIDLVGSEAPAKSPDTLQRELFELRSELHTARQERQYRVEQALLEAGIVTSLVEISTKLQALERERRRLQDNFFGHELVTCEAPCSSGNPISLELVQEDALLLIEKRQAALKQLAERTKEAMTVARTHALQLEAALPTLAREKDLIEQIQHVEFCLRSMSEVHSDRINVATDAAQPSEIPVLTRCRSMPNGFRPDFWEKMGARDRMQLHSELRTAASFHIRRDRVVLNATEVIGVSDTETALARDPSQADKLGIKARFMEKSQRNIGEINRAYLDALELDDNHADNLGNYALFLGTTCGQPQQAKYYFQQALVAKPKNAKNLANYAYFLIREYSDFNQSEICYKEALDIAPNDVNILGAYSDLLTAKAHGNKSKLMVARQILSKALNLLPSHQKNRLRLALVLADLEENKLAERCFEILLQQNRTGTGGGLQYETSALEDKVALVYIYESYAVFLHRCREWPRAKLMYSEALALDPQRPSLIRQL